MDRLWFELRLACRRLTARPGFTAIAVLSLAVGIGATAVFFSLLNSTLLKPLPLPQPEQLVSLVDPRFAAPVLSYPNYVDLRDRNRVFTGLAAYRIAVMNTSTGAGRNLRMWGVIVSGNYFSTLGVTPHRGRLLSEADDQKRGAHPVAVLSHASWRARFAGDPAVVGRQVKVNGYPFTIVGIAPPEFSGTERFFAPEIFLPTSMTRQVEPANDYLDDRDSQNTFIIGRLRPGLTSPQGEAGLVSEVEQLAREHPKENRGWKLKLTPPGWGGDYLRGSVIQFTAALMILAGVLLLVVCVNLASLLLAQAAERRKETAIRLAIGAGQGQLIRQLLLESLVLSMLGGTLGFVLATWAVDLLVHYRPPVDFAFAAPIAVDWGVFLFSLGVTVSASFVFGLVPAWQSTRTELTRALKNDVGDTRRRRWPLRDLMVGAQVVLSVVLLICSALMIRSLNNAMRLNVGFEPSNAAVIGMDLDLQGYSPEKGKAFQKELLRRAAELPGVRSVSFANSIPLDLNISNSAVYEAGQPEPPPSEMVTAQVYDVMPAFFETLRTRVLAGREFTERDTESTQRVLVVNRRFIQKILKLERPDAAVGRRVQTQGRPYEIIGVVEDGKYVGLTEAPKAVMFFSGLQRYGGMMRLVFRTEGPPEPVLASVQQLILSMDSEMTTYQASTLERHLDFPLLPARLAAGAMSVFGFVTMALAAIGIYGVMAFAVSRRTREIGIRMAIGASPGQVGTLVLHRALWLVGSATVLGVLLGAAAAGALAPILVGVDARDPVAMIAGVSVMVVIAFVACWGPMRRAIRLDPAQALRQD
jgi:predicted permease